MSTARGVAGGDAVNEFTVGVFEQTADYTEVRLTGPDGTRCRGLDRAGVEALVESVSREYSRGAGTHRVFGSIGLRELGERLFAFLDGDERWCDQVRQGPAGAVLRVEAEDRLRHLPWETLSEGGQFLSVAGVGPVLPVRTLRRGPAGGAGQPANRPLRVLFMASSPEDVEPVLEFEKEEASILEATVGTVLDLVVEESGSLAGLRSMVEAYGAGYFDVLHLSGHAGTNGEGIPVFLVEDEAGQPQHATADQIAQTLEGRWPPMVFLSGCWTGAAGDDGAVPSMSESLVRAGAATVLGWALPVGDNAATAFAAELYRGLAAGRRLDYAVTAARRALFTAKSANWHLLRVYAAPSPLAEMVTPAHTPGRARLTVRPAEAVFLDPVSGLSRVASRTQFVGRRRVIQRCLTTLKHPTGHPEAVQGLVLHGLGGLGKSTLASRLLDRFPTHQRVVWYGKVDLTKFFELPDKITFKDAAGHIDRTAHREALDLLPQNDLTLAVRLRYLLEGPLAERPCLFVFDDFESGNLTERAGSHVLNGDTAQILPALLEAIRDAASPSRVIITSRYQFPVPARTRLHEESLETLTPVEQHKKIKNLSGLRPDAPTALAVRARAITAAAGNPRLLDWLNLVVTDPALDTDTLLAEIENKTDTFRETILLQKLLDSQDPELARMLAQINVVELPVPAETVHAIHDHPDTDQHIRRATQLGLLEQGTDPQTHRPRYYVSNVLRPLLTPRLTPEDHTDACAAAARSLYRTWINTTTNDQDVTGEGTDPGADDAAPAGATPGTSR